MADVSRDRMRVVGQEGENSRLDSLRSPPAAAAAPPPASSDPARILPVSEEPDVGQRRVDNGDNGNTDLGCTDTDLGCIDTDLGGIDQSTPDYKRWKELRLHAERLKQQHLGPRDAEVRGHEPVSADVPNVTTDAYDSPELRSDPAEYFPPQAADPGLVDASRDDPEERKAGGEACQAAGEDRDGYPKWTSGDMQDGYCLVSGVEAAHEMIYSGYYDTNPSPEYGPDKERPVSLINPLLDAVPGVSPDTDQTTVPTADDDDDVEPAVSMFLAGDASICSPSDPQDLPGPEAARHSGEPGASTSPDAKRQSESASTLLHTRTTSDAKSGSDIVSVRLQVDGNGECRTSPDEQIAVVDILPIRSDQWFCSSRDIDQIHSAVKRIVEYESRRLLISKCDTGLKGWLLSIQQKHPTLLEDHPQHYARPSNTASESSRHGKMVTSGSLRGIKGSATSKMLSFSKKAGRKISAAAKSIGEISEFETTIVGERGSPSTSRDAKRSSVIPVRRKDETEKRSPKLSQSAAPGSKTNTSALSRIRSIISQDNMAGRSPEQIVDRGEGDKAGRHSFSSRRLDLSEDFELLPESATGGSPKMLTAADLERRAAEQRTAQLYAQQQQAQRTNYQQNSMRVQLTAPTDCEKVDAISKLLPHIDRLVLVDCLRQADNDETKAIGLAVKRTAAL